MKWNVLYFVKEVPVKIRMLLNVLLIFGVLTIWTATGESRILKYCASVFTTPEPIFKTEQELRDEGYREKYIEGLDHARSNLQIAYELRTGSINSTTSHIEEFADLIDPHIAFIESGIHQNDYSEDFNRALRLEQLDFLKSEAQEQKNLEQVTYEYFFFFNSRLAWVVDPASEVSDISIIRQRRRYITPKTPIIGEFPERILIPTIQDLGYMAINETHGTGVHLIGLTNSLEPVLFWLHDLGHALQRRIDRSQMARIFMQKRARLPRHQREPVEWIFFNLTHEQSHTVFELYYHIESQVIKDISTEEDRRLFKKLLRESFWESGLSYIFPWLRI